MRTQLSVLATCCARGLQIHLPPQKKRGRTRPSREGAGKTGCALHPRSRVQSSKQKRTRAYRFSGNTPAFPAQWFYGLSSCSPRRDHSLFVTVASVIRSIITDLTPAIGASGPHDFAVRFMRRSSKALPRPSLPAPTSVTMANAPSLGTGWQGISS